MQALIAHGLSSSPSATTVRAHLALTAPHDLQYVYGLEAPSAEGRSGEGSLKRERTPDGGGTDDEDDGKGRDLYKDEGFDLFAHHGKAPVGAGKLPL
jgi:hypothetical protein